MVASIRLIFRRDDVMVGDFNVRNKFARLLRMGLISEVRLLVRNKSNLSNIRLSIILIGVSTTCIL